MRLFQSLLKDINNKLDLPQPLKSRILLDISSDLYDFYRTAIEQGISEDEAVEKAINTFCLSDENLQELIAIHEIPFRKWIDRLSVHSISFWEKMVMVFIMTSIAAVTGRVILTTTFFKNISPFAFPMVGIAFIVVAKALEKSYTLFLKKEHNPKTLRKGLSGFILLGASNVIIGLTGYFFELLKTGDHDPIMVSQLIFFYLQPDSGHSLFHFINWMMLSSSTIMLCFFVTMMSVSIWFGFESKIIKLEMAEAETLFHE